jgi:predicted Zn-dependent protease
LTVEQFNWTDEDLYLIAERGHLLYLQGRFDEAKILFEGLVSINPRDWYFNNALAAIYIKMSNPHAAVELLDELLRQYPADIESRIRRCEALLEAGRTEEAKAQLLELRSRHSDPRIARLALRLGMQRESDIE